MATLINFYGTIGPGITELGFINLPAGNWTFHYNLAGQAISANDPNKIPIVLLSASASSSSGSLNLAYDNNDIGRVYGWGGSGSTSSGSYSTSWSNVQGTLYHIFLPTLYNWDCSLLQSLSGTFSVWLEK